MHVTVLSNGILLKGTRLQKLATLPYRDRLTLQISLDGSTAAIHDGYRGTGSWQKAIDAIQRLKAGGFHVRLGTTQTPENSHDLASMCQLHPRDAQRDKQKDDKMIGVINRQEESQQREKRSQKRERSRVPLMDGLFVKKEERSGGTRPHQHC
jgi:sulfatase maturation enzyme AslB (radical SAM superfamily)